MPQDLSTFTAKLLRPATQSNPDCGDGAFVLLPGDVSAKLPRRGRTTVAGTMNGCAFTIVAEPDGAKGHWLPLDRSLLKKASVKVGDEVEFEIAPAAKELEPIVPDDFAAALQASPQAMDVWQSTTTIARIDWVHWITTAKQAKTRAKRIEDACEMLADGKKRVCCFDPSGFYSKAFKAPEAMDDGN